jgi:hypothetical protein
VGDIYTKESEESQSQDALDKAIDIYGEAMQNARWNDTRTHVYADCYGTALLSRFDQMGVVDDIHNSVLMLEDTVRLTPDGHPDKPSLLNNLSTSLARSFECLGNLSDINKSILMFEEAV